MNRQNNNHQTTTNQVETTTTKANNHSQNNPQNNHNIIGADQTFGVEVEMNNITRRRAAELVAEYFGTKAWYSDAEFGYKSWSCKDGQGRVWKFERDASIKGNDNERTEMVTPILTYSDMETLQEIIRLLRRNHAKSYASGGCGVHIHVGAEGQDAKSLRNLANIMAKYEDLLLKAINVNYSRRNQYCKTVDPSFLAQMNSKKPETMSELADIWYRSQDASWGRGNHYNPSRYHALNYHATFTKGTIEFRLFQFDEAEEGRSNGLHAGVLKSYIQLCLALADSAKRLKSASCKKPQVENDKYAMRTWLLRLGFIGDEYKTAREVLTKRLNGSAAWRHTA